MRALILLVIILVSTAGMFSQNVPNAGLDSIKLDVSLVSMNVAVVDSLGKSVTALSSSDFEILEDGVSQPIRNFSLINSPYNVLLLLDCSDSTRDRMDLLMDGMARFLSQLRTRDRVEMAAFGADVHLLFDWKADTKRKISFLNNPMCRSTDFYGALDWSVKELREVTGRSGVVVFSDGFHTDIARQEVSVNGNKVLRVVPPAQDREFQKILKKVQESGAPFYFVAVDTDLNPGRDYAGPVPDLQQVRSRMELLAEASGGRIAYPKESTELVSMFLDIGRDLGSSYSLAYSPPRAKDGKYHAIDVRVRGGSYQVQYSPKGYTAN